MFYKSVTPTLPPSAWVCAARVLFLLILHFAARKGRWCKLRRAVFSTADLVCVWGDAACVVWSRRAAALPLQEDVWLATGAHDALTHAPVLLAVVWMERGFTAQAAAVLCAAVLQRATLAMWYGGTHYALAGIALRFAWLAFAQTAGRPAPPRKRSAVHVV